MTDTPTIEELALRVGEIESELGVVMQKVDDHERRLDASEKEREWMLAVLLRVLDGVSEVKQRTTVIVQRDEAIESSLSQILSKVERISAHAAAIEALEKKLDARPCLVDPCAHKE